MAGDPAPLGRRLLCLVYEGLLLFAVLWFAGLALTLLERALDFPHSRAVQQTVLVLITAAYFTWHWTRTGQTLAMKAWRLRLVGRDGRAITVRVALTRYFIALAGTAALGIGFLWAIVDRERLFLHDRLAGTRIVGSG